MYIVKMKSKTESQYLIENGCPKWIEIAVAKFERIEDAAKLCRECNEHTKKFHNEKMGKLIHYIKEV